MKTAISLPDDLFAAAEDAADRDWLRRAQAHTLRTTATASDLPGGW
ncbi:hypothetical protein tb265_05640 [Gemmatimonadetes bacterium T265]|nr:hypothetical protein tb265_05640 [Gemmatimonadetes bacterium T265]